jgi:hypothetical protein
MSDFFVSAVVGFIMGLLFGLFSTGILAIIIAENSWREKIVERGLAQYCPMTGDWAWIGECDE